MAGKVTVGFEPESVAIPLADILPLRLVEDTARKRRKFRQIAASIREIGIVQPPIVARRSGKPSSIRGAPERVAPNWTRSTYLHTGPRHTKRRIERPDTRLHLTA
ncbi:MAG: hypothetical protein OXC10_00435 [Rhodospirillaceae bacterium]|nr:hypothetical protein [Rhodospirillaceae bacterium]